MKKVFLNFTFLIIAAINTNIYTAAKIQNDKDISMQVINAIKAGDLAKLETLIDQGFDVNGRYGNTPVLFAVIKGRELKNKKEIVELLIKKGAYINQLNDIHDRDTPLITALENRELDIAKLLIDFGADINAINNINESVISLGTKRGDIELFKKLLSKIKDINADVIFEGINSSINRNMLSLAVMYDRKDLVQLLLDSGADINKTDGFGFTPLMNAVNWRVTDIIPLLLNYGANLDIAEPKEGETAFDLAPTEEIKQMLLAERERREVAAKERQAKINQELDKTGMPKVLVDLTKSYLPDYLLDYVEAEQEAKKAKLDLAN